MNQVKIGKFIAECRKKENLTQMQFAKNLISQTELFQNGKQENRCPIHL